MPDLYHYCSTETLVSIISSRSIRLSSLTLSNDSKEGELIKEILMRIAQEAQLYPSVLMNLERSLQFTYDLFDGLGFCLSENGDLLSQWRGYADDGHGVSIGFRSEYLEALAGARTGRDENSFQLTKLIYDASRQTQIAHEHFEKLKPLLERGAFKSTVGSILAPVTEAQRVEIQGATNKAFVVILQAMLRMFEIKHPAFAEEIEWRLVSFSMKKDDQSVNRFRACKNKVVPYLEVPLESLEQQAISSVVLGPRHTTPPHVIKQMFASAGLGSPEITKSAATYR